MAAHIDRIWISLCVAILAIIIHPAYGLSVAADTGSMEPAIYGGDFTIYDRTRTPQAGDVNLFRDTAGTLIAHRLVNIDDDGMMTHRGDANMHDDRPVPPDAVEGTIVIRIPKIGWPILQATRMFMPDRLELAGHTDVG